MIDINSQAANYAEGKANEVITKAIAYAYVAGYKAGYEDRESGKSVDLHDNETEYVDLGLPSHTLWPTDFAKGEEGYSLNPPYCEAEKYNIPSQEQWQELLHCCHLSSDASVGVWITGPNGKEIHYKCYPLLWIKSETDSDYKNLCGHISSNHFIPSATLEHQHTGRKNNIFVVKVK